jgi:hypothetical protein
MVDFSAIASDISAKVAAANAAIAASKPLRTASPVALAPVKSAVADALASLDAGIAEIDADIATDSVGGVVTGIPAPLVWQALLGQVTDCEQLRRLLEARSYLARVSANLAGATG